MPLEVSKYREAVTDRLDDELSHWQGSLDHLRLCTLDEGASSDPSLQVRLERLENELLKARHQWQRMKNAPASDWRRERETLAATFSRIQWLIYELQSRLGSA